MVDQVARRLELVVRKRLLRVDLLRRLLCVDGGALTVPVDFGLDAEMGGHACKDVRFLLLNEWCAFVKLLRLADVELKPRTFSHAFLVHGHEFGQLNVGFGR